MLMSVSHIVSTPVLIMIKFESGLKNIAGELEIQTPNELYNKYKYL